MLITRCHVCCFTPFCCSVPDVVSPSATTQLFFCNLLSFREVLLPFSHIPGTIQSISIHRFGAPWMEQRFGAGMSEPSPSVCQNKDMQMGSSSFAEFQTCHGCMLQTEMAKECFCSARCLQLMERLCASTRTPLCQGVFLAGCPRGGPAWLSELTMLHGFFSFRTANT